MSTQPTPSPVYLIWSNEHDAWWRPNSCGYTTFIESAGRYSKAEAEDICSFARSPVNNQIVPPEVMVDESIALNPSRYDSDEIIRGTTEVWENFAALVRDRDTWKKMAERLDKKVIEEQTDHNKTIDKFLLLRHHADKLCFHLYDEYCKYRSPETESEYVTEIVTDVEAYQKTRKSSDE